MLLRVILQGGLGNQLFQLAAGQSYRRSGDALLIDTTLLGGKSHHPGVADRNFECRELCQTLDARVTTRPWWPPALYRRTINRVALRREAPRVLRRRWVLGSHIRWLTSDAIPLEFTDAIINTFPNAMDLTPRQGVHVRLGDYSQLAHIYGSPNAAYYRSAFEAAFAPDQPITVFSDSPPAALRFLEEVDGRRQYVLARSLQWPSMGASGAWEDLLRMASCCRLVTANSTYSWWAGLLRTRLDSSQLQGAVVAPSVMWPTALPAPPGTITIDWPRVLP